MRPRKLIYIMNSYSSNESSHFHHVPGLLEALAARGIEITLVIEKANSIPAFSGANIDVIILKHRFGLMRFLELFCVITKLIRQGFTRTFVRIAAPAALTAALAHRIFGGSVFLWQSGTAIEYDMIQPISGKKLKWYLGSYIPNAIARRFVHYFVTGPAFMADYYSRICGVRKEKIRLLYNDVDIGRFTPPEDCSLQKTIFLKSHRFEPESLILLMVHRLSPVRRTRLYFPSCLTPLLDDNLLSSVVVVAAGTGSELSSIQAEAKHIGVAERCVFLGDVPNREIHKLYAVADIFLHPTYNEGFPRVILEAMAAGLPIVSTDAGGTRELMGELQSNCVVSKDDPQSFAVFLKKLIIEPSLRQRLANENQAHVERFSTANVAAMYDEVLFT